MKLSIIVVHYKTPELLKLCLKSLVTNVSKDMGYEIIVVDSETSRISQDAILENFPNVKLMPFKENIGYAKGVNEGISKAKGDYFLILNSDIIILPGSVERMVEYLEKNTETGLVGPQLLDFNGNIQKTYFRFYTPLTILGRRTFLGKLPFFNKTIERFTMEEADPKNIFNPDWIMGAALMTSKKAIEKVGVMDERFSLYFEDVDWARRFWENGYKITYLPGAQMYHYHQRQSKAGFDIFDFFIRRQTRTHIASAIKYFIKYGLSTTIQRRKV